MMSQVSSTQPPSMPPPRIAVWLIGLFTPDKEAEAVPGDLLEEFSHLAAESGVVIARRWYWRQTAKTITHLAGAAFRSAPWTMAAAIVGGFLLHGFLSGLPEKFLSAVTDRYLMFWSAHFQAYTWVLDGVGIAHLMASLLVGCMAAWAAKGREMVATMALALVFCGMVAAALVWVATRRPIDVAWLLWASSGPFAIVMGGFIVRTRRSRNRDSSPTRLGTTRA
jgi:hypothetical protein